jgi:hypothetical protein
MEKPIYKVGDELRLEELSPEQLAYLQQSQMAGISTDPRYKDAELAALSALEERSTKGMTAQDEADMYKLQRNVSTQNRGRMGAIQNNMAVRGMSGSGMDALMQMQANQDATDREALSAMEKAGQIQQNKMQASQQLGQMGSQMRGQDFQEQAAKARAADEIARFNAQTRNQGLSGQVNTRNQATGQNWNRRNQVGDQNTTMSYNYDAEQANREMLAAQERERKASARRGIIPGIIGGVAGGFAGGPAGAAAGYQVGSTIGGYAYGGDVQPDQDDPSLDVVPAMLSPGEHVLPRSVMSSEEAFKDYTNRLKEAVRERQNAVDSAESNAKMGQYGSVFANALNDYSKANRKDVVLHNNIQNMGRAPSISQGEFSQIKDTWSDPLNQELARADKGLAQGKSEFQDQEAMRNFFDQNQQKSQLLAAEGDINSPQAKQANMVYKSVLLGKAREAELAGDTEGAAMIKQSIASLQPMPAKAALAQAASVKDLDYKTSIAALGDQAKLRAASAENQTANAFKERELGLKAQGQQQEVSRGNRTLDTEFAKDYNDWTSGGSATTDKNLAALKETAKKLEEYVAEDDSPTGRFTGVMPDFLKSNEAIKLKDNVRSAVSSSLKEILGPAFTAPEGERQIENSYNERLPAKDNLDKLRASIKELEAKKAAKDAKANYFRERGTLDGFNPQSMTQTVGQVPNQGGATGTFDTNWMED